MFSDSLVILKGIRSNNLYYLKGSTVSENLTTSEHLKDNMNGLQKMRLRQVDMDSLQAFAVQGVLEDALTCNLELSNLELIRRQT